MKYFFTLFILLTIVACKLPETKRGITSNKEIRLPDQTADSIDVIYSEKGVIKMRLKSPLLVMKDTVGSQYNKFPNGVLMDFFDKDGMKNADLTADFGVDDPTHRERYAKGNVVINHKDGSIYETDEIYIDEKRDSVHNNGHPVKLTKPDGTLIQGDSFRSNGRLDFIEIKNVFDSTVPFEESQLGTGSEGNN